jgi:hypothetical protein
MVIVHTLAVVIFLETWPRGSTIPKLPLSIIVLLETVLMLVFIWKKIQAEPVT